MKRMSKKGFTIVELVIVIAIIAILAAVMIPTFSGVVSDAKDSAAISGANAAYTQYVSENAGTDAELLEDFIFVSDGRWVAIKGGNAVDVYTSEADALANFTAVDDPATTDVENTVQKAATATVGELYAIESVYVAPAAGGEG